MRTLPVPRPLFLMADLILWSLVALPGTVLGVVVGASRFHVHLHVTGWVVVAAIVVSLTAAAVGYAMASLLPPQVANLLSQVLVFVVLLFSPVSYPADRLPHWLATAHQWLPVQPMADVMRWSLASDTFALPARSVVVLAAWCVAAVTGATWALRRRV
jgi:ABC-2 type transport system permease protein